MLIIFFLLFIHIHLTFSCNNYKGACVCSVDSCDFIPPIGDISDKIALYVSNTKGLRLQKSFLSFANESNGAWNWIDMDLGKSYQKILGFGGAFTDAATLNFKFLNSEVRDLLVRSYWGDDGLRYSMGRIPIASSDFSSYVYSYDDFDNDYSMSNFTIDMDRMSGKIGFIKMTIEEAAKSHRNLLLYGSSWSPPWWMKTNKDRIGGKLIGKAGDDIHKSYALYLTLFVEEYSKALGIPIWGLTVQNEPLAIVNWDSCYFTAEDEADFLYYDLGPLLKKRFPNIKIIIQDDQRSQLPKYSETVIKKAKEYVDGIGFHWYESVDDLFGFWYFSNIKETAKLYPDLFLLSTEACQGEIPIPGIRGDWTRGLVYLYDILYDIDNGANGWVDWNLLLDMQGGPNHVKNYVDSPILVDINHPDRFYKNPMYYALAHFSYFVPPSSVRIECSTKGLLSPDVVCFRTPDKQIVIVAMNRDMILNRKIYIKVPKRGYINIELTPSSIQTFVFNYDI